MASVPGQHTKKHVLPRSFDPSRSASEEKGFEGSFEVHSQLEFKMVLLRKNPYIISAQNIVTMRFVQRSFTEVVRKGRMGVYGDNADSNGKTHGSDMKHAGCRDKRILGIPGGPVFQDSG